MQKKKKKKGLHIIYKVKEHPFSESQKNIINTLIEFF